MSRYELALFAAAAALGVWLSWPFWADPGSAIRSDPGGAGGTIAHGAPETVTEAPLEAWPPAPRAPLRQTLPPTRTLEASSRLIVAVRGILGEPLADISVSLRRGNPVLRRAMTDAGGEVSFEGLAAGLYMFRIETSGRPELQAGAAVSLAASQTKRLELRLGEHDRSIAGRVLDQDGAPVAGLIVKARPYRPAATVLVPVDRSEHWAESSGDGTFEINALTDGDYEVRTLADDSYLSAEAVVRAGIETAVLRVVERKEIRVFGQVTSPHGEALAGARVIPLGASSRRVRTDQDGRYELLVPMRDMVGRHRIAFQAERHHSEHLDFDADGLDGRADLRLDAVLEPLAETVTIDGRVMDEQGMPVAGEQVYLQATDINTHYRAVSGADGSFAFPVVAAGSNYHLRVLPRGPYKDYVRGSLDLSADNAGLEIVLQALAVGTFSGYMIDPAGAPVPGFSLRLRSADARGRGGEVRSDSQGYFEVEDVPAGALTLQTPSLPRFQLTGIEISAGADAYAVLVLDWGDVDLEGRVVDAGGDPLPGAEVNLDWSHTEGSTHSRASRSTITDSNGGFRFSRLSRAPHRLGVAAGQGSHQQVLQSGVGWIEVRLERDRP